MFPKKEQYDLVIVGGGLAGLAAAVTAGEEGLTALVVEKGRSLGGNGNYVEGAMGVNSQLQQQAGVEIDPVELLQEELQYSHYEANAPHLKQFIDQSGATIDWLAQLGVQFAGVGGQGKSWPTIHSFTGGGAQAVSVLQAKVAETGTEIVRSLSACEILQTNGQVSGLVVQDEVTGQRREVQTKHVILATGGYVDNPELVAQKSPFAKRLLAVSNGKATGDGLQLAWQAGAKHYQLGAIQYGGGAIYDTVQPPFTHMASQLAAAATQEAILWVNEQGQRFVNEDVNDNMCHAGAAILTQSRVFSILDQAAVDHLATVGLYKEVGNSPVSPEKLADLPAEIKQDLANQQAYLTSASSLEELAQQLNLPALPVTIEHYNELVRGGTDTDFGKAAEYLTPVQTGPYYAVELGVGMACALGGLRVNQAGEVLNPQGYPVSGLYAVGNDAGGMLVGDTYAVTLPGSTAGYAVYSARNAVHAICRPQTEAQG